MKLFTCGSCGQTVYFHNVRCVRCDSRLGFAPEQLTLLAFEQADGAWRTVGSDSGSDPQPTHQMCANYLDHAACNWMVPTAERQPLCRGCRLNRTIPDLSIPRNLTLWRRLQVEKNRLLYGLMRLALPVVSLTESPSDGLAFDFLADPDPWFDKGEGSAVVTGHANGVITLDIAEADDALRERMRQQMAEPYRTILGHFRHESGHYYWDRLVRGSRWLETFRELFGDERGSYSEALRHHYAQGPPSSWPQHFVSAYASSHPWEDWAESWAHYLHMVDTLETSWQLGLRLSPRVEEGTRSAVAGTFDPIGADDFQALIDHWLPLTSALNSLTHSMGQGDAYPFVLAPPVIAKLELVHTIIRAQAGERG
jgi:hypothetical protein